jgi:hypothetical protein
MQSTAIDVNTLQNFNSANLEQLDGEPEPG